MSLDEKLIGKSNIQSTYFAYKNQKHETPVFRVLPNFLFKFRYLCLSIFNRKVFRFLAFDITVGGLVFMAVLLTGVVAAEITAFGFEKEKFSYTGRINFVLLCLIFSFGSRNSIWALLAGMSMERALVWHKTCVLLLLATGLLHGWLNTWKSAKGIYLYSFIVIISLTALWFIRRHFFYYFYVIHTVLIGVIIYCTFHHGIAFNVYASLFWVFDIAIRGLFNLYFMIKGNKFKIDLSFQKRFVTMTSKNKLIAHRPGQYFFITIPRLSLIEPHPFSAASISSENLTFNIRMLGDWTAQLISLASKQNEVTAFIDGPYGIPTIDIESTYAKHFILIAGGIGINYIRPWAHHLITQVNQGRKLKSITFLWTVRETELLELISFPSSIIDALKANESQNNSFFNLPDSRKFNFDLQIFLKSDLESFNKAQTPVKKYVKRKPLDLGYFFQSFSEQVKCKTPTKVKVLCCGPSKMIDHCFKFSQKLGYDLHSEYFEL
jgi:NAD(P)H-flavin reductase